MQVASHIIEDKMEDFCSVTYACWCCGKTETFQDETEADCHFDASIAGWDVDECGKDLCRNCLHYER